MTQACLLLTYDGTGFKGWQKNGRSRTVQEVPEKGLSKLLSRKISVEVASRTDSGVHAKGQRAVFAANGIALPIEQLPQIANKLLLSDLVILSAHFVNIDFHPSLWTSQELYRN